MKKISFASVLVSLALVFACFASLAVSADLTATVDNVAAGKSYTTSGIYANTDGTVPYPDTDGVELTDGLVPATTAYTEAGWVGFNSNSDEYKTNGYAEIVVDLGAVTSISGVSVAVNNAQNSGIGAPAEFKYFYSANGSDWTEIGTGSYDVDPFEKNGEEFVNKDKVVNNSVASEVSAKYVKVQFTNSTGATWMFIGEVQVLAAAGSENSSAAESSAEATSTAESSAAASSTAESSQGGTPETGDSGLVALAVVSVIALAGAVVIKRK